MRINFNRVFNKIGVASKEMREKSPAKSEKFPGILLIKV